MAGLMVVAVSAVCAADGFMVPRVVEVGEAADVVSSPKQEAVLVFDGQTVQVILRTHFRAGPEEVAWFVPVPAEPTEVVPGRERIFEALHRATVPKFLTVGEGGGKGLGCAAGRSVASHDAVVVKARGTAGIYEYVVLAGRDAAQMVEWLRTNRFAVPAGAEEGFRRYVDAGWHWLAMKVRVEMAEYEAVAPHPVVYTYEDTKLVYPLAISRLMAEGETEVLLYVVAGGRYRVTNWANAALSDVPVALSGIAASGTTYEAGFQRMTDARGGRLFVTECARNLDNVRDRPLLGLITQRDPLASADFPTPFLTRLRAVVSVRAMDQDVVLGPHPTPEESVSNVRYVRAAASGDRPQSGPRLAALMGALALASGLAGSRHRAGRAGAIACIAVACLLVAV